LSARRMRFGFFVALFSMMVSSPLFGHPLTTG
jgi:hypothetical protein